MGRSDSLQYMQDRVKDFLLQPDSLSKEQKARIRKAFNSGLAELTIKEAGNVLDRIRRMDSELAARLKRFTPHDSRQISLIRDVLLQTWTVGKMNTQQISVIGARPASRLVSSEAMA